ncbi:hypothetical protein Tco_0945756 [Tanacetum coccineum]
MSSITAQQAKFDLELVPKEKRLEIGKCNERLNPRKNTEQPTFKLFLDALALQSMYSCISHHCRYFRKLRHTEEINSLNDVVVDQMHQPWRTFAALINMSLSGKTTGLDNLRLSRAQIL